MATKIATEQTTPLCPDWCELEPHHGWELGAPGADCRGHVKRFGKHVQVSALEFEREPGVTTPPTVFVEGLDDASAAEVLVLAHQMLNASDWLEKEAQR